MTADDFVHDASRRHLMRRAATVGLMMRNCVNLLVALVSLVDDRDHYRRARFVDRWHCPQPPPEHIDRAYTTFPRS